MSKCNWPNNSLGNGRNKWILALLKKFQQKKIIFKRKYFYQRHQCFFLLPVSLILFWYFPIRKILWEVRNLLWGEKILPIAKSYLDLRQNHLMRKRKQVWPNYFDLSLSWLLFFSPLLAFRLVPDVWKLWDVGELENFSWGHDIWSLEASLQRLGSLDRESLISLFPIVTVQNFLSHTLWWWNGRKLELDKSKNRVHHPNM